MAIGNNEDERKSVAKNFLGATDIYICANNIEKSFSYFQGKKAPSPTTDNDRYLYKNLLDAIYKVRQEDPEEDDHVVIFMHNIFRVFMIDGVKDKVFACRKMPTKFIELDQIGIPSEIKMALLDQKLCEGGLIVICGAPGNGKTTTCAALIKERLKRYAGVCITAEDPNEIDINGRHGDGICIQTRVKKKLGFAGRVRELMRAYPAGRNCMMLIGEVRDKETTVEALNSAIDGRLVIITMHAESIVGAINRLYQFANRAMSKEESLPLLSSAIRIIVHQKFDSNGLNVEYLKVNTDVKSRITHGKFSELGDIIDQQNHKYSS